MKRASNIVAAAVLVMAGCGLLLALYWLVWPYETLEILNEPVPVLNDPVRPGEYLELDVDYCKHTNVRSTLARYLVNDILVQLNTPAGGTSVPIGCRRVVGATVQIPAHIPPDTYYLETTVYYYVNPLRTIRQTYRTESFEVVAGDN